METLKAIETRKSVRNYLETPVEQEKLDAVLASGNRAPLGGPFHMTAVRCKPLLDDINSLTLAFMRNSPNEFARSRAALPGYQPLYGAPVLIVVSGSDPERSAASAACAITAMTIAAADLGLGSCYVMSPVAVLNEPDLSALLDLPDGYRAIAGMLLGYAGEERFSRPRPAEDNINYVDSY